MGQGATPSPLTGHGLSAGLAEAVEGQAEAEPGRPLPGVGAFLLPPQVPPGWGRALLRARGPRPLAGGPLPTHPSASSFPEHPIAQLLRQLQCAVYTRLYPAISQGTADVPPASPTGLSFLSLDAGGSLPAEPGGRRLRTSRSLHCMFSVPEHGLAGLRHSLSSTPLADGGPGTPRATAAPQTPRESSFEDLERFLASPEGWAPGEPLAGPGQETALPEQLKGVVRDIHNAIGEGWPMGSGGCAGAWWGLSPAVGSLGGGPLHPVVLAGEDSGCRVGRTGWGSRWRPLSVLRNSSLPRQAAVPDTAGLRGAQHRRRQGPVPGLPGGSLLPPALGPAVGPLQVPRPRGRVPRGLPWPPPRQPLASLPAGACTGPASRPWLGAWSGTGTPAPLTWGCPPASSPRPPAAPHMAPPSRTCASSRWRPVPAGSWSASVRGGEGGVQAGRGVRRGGGVTLSTRSVPQCGPCAASASVPRSTAAPGTAGPLPPLPCEYSVGGTEGSQPHGQASRARAMMGSGVLAPLALGVQMWGWGVPSAGVTDGSRWWQRGRRPAAHPVLRGAADGAAPAAVRVRRPGGVHPRGVGASGGCWDTRGGVTTVPPPGTGLEAWGGELCGSHGSCGHRALVVSWL